MNYIEVNMTDEKFCNLLKKSIENKTPLSMARFGDGELAPLRRSHSNVPGPTWRAGFRKVWGYDESTYKIGENLVVEILNRALKNSDVIGLMNPKNEIAKALGQTQYGSQWGLLKSRMEKVNRTKKLLVCDHQVPRGKSLGDLNNFKNILNGNDLHIISPRTERLKKNNINKILECKVSYTQAGMERAKPMRLKHSRHKLFEKIDDIEENIVLVALSLMGKDIPQYLSARGKICLDVGVVVDAWAGMIMREWFRLGGLQRHCFIGE